MVRQTTRLLLTVALARGPQLDLGDAGGDVQAFLALDAQRLQ